MPVITFWSNNEKNIGQTVSAAVAATMMAIDHNYKVLLISLDFNDIMIENCFGEQESNKDIIKSLIQKTQINLESGIEGLLKLSDSNRVTPEVIHDYTKIIFKNRLEVLYSPISGECAEEKSVMEKMKNLIINASRYYDQVFVDLKKGIKYSEQLDILNLSDVVVVNVDQKIQTIEKFMQSKEFEKLQHKLIWNICKYNKDSKYNIKNLSRTILKKQIVCQTNYNTQIFDATQDGSLAELLIRFRTLREDEENLEFITKIRKISEEILLKYQQLRSGI